MDFELRRAREKLEKEQKERKERAKARLEREKRAKEEARRQREAIEAAQRSRRLDALEAQQKIEQQMEESLLAWKGISFYRILEAVPCQGVGDKIKLPPSCFTELSDQGAFDKGPLYFRLSVVQQGVSSSASDGEENLGIAHSGVLEFTADEGTVGLPPEVWNNLFQGDSPATPLVEVRYMWLPKGTYAKLQPGGIGFSDLPNHKAILETSLRQRATLSQNDVLIVSYGKLSYKLRVLELKPSSSVSVLETDVEVDIESPDSVSGRVDEHALVPLKLGTSESGMVHEGHYIYYKFSIEDDVWEKIASEEAVVVVKIEVEETSNGDTDLYVSKHPLIFPTTLHQHEWSSHDVGSKSLILSSKHTGLGSGTFSIGVYGFQGTTKYQVSVQVHDNKKPAGQQVAMSSSSMEVDTVVCKNCKRQIPSRTIALHEAYCSRHNVVCQHVGCGIVLRVEDAKKHVHCDKCGQALQNVEMEKHMKVFHEPLRCPCGVVLEKQQMVEHQAAVCPLRLIPCRFCGDMVQAGDSAADIRDRLRGLSEHESICGSRTAPCDSCGRSVMLKDMDLHHVAVHPKS